MRLVFLPRGCNLLLVARYYMTACYECQTQITGIEPKRQYSI